MKKSLAFIIVMLPLMAVLYLISDTSQTNAAVNTQFDHSTCQYPDRTTNPPGGCDNSDPCDPANAAKGGSGECVPQSDIEGDIERKPVVIEPKKVPVNQCGGK